MKEPQSPNWGLKVLKGYIALVTTSILLSFLVWAVWAVNEWPSPINLERNYEALFAVMFGVFIFAPIMVYLNMLIPPHHGTGVRRLYYALIAALGIAMFFVFRGLILLFQAAVLWVF